MYNLNLRKKFLPLHYSVLMRAFFMEDKLVQEGSSQSLAKFIDIWEIIIYLNTA